MIQTVFLLTDYKNYNQVIKEAINESHKNINFEVFDDPYQLEEVLKERKPDLLIAEIDSFKNSQLYREFSRPLNRVLCELANKNKLSILNPGHVMNTNLEDLRLVKNMIVKYVLPKIDNISKIEPISVAEIKQRLYSHKLKSVEHLMESHSHSAKEYAHLKRLKENYKNLINKNNSSSLQLKIKILSIESKFIKDFLRNKDFYVNNRVKNNSLKTVFERGLKIEKEIAILRKKTSLNNNRHKPLLAKRIKHHLK
jgi:hypothetical protein